MSPNDLPERLIAQFSEDRGDVWGALALLFPTERFLNLGYSGRYQTYLLGSPQERLVARVLAELSSLVGDGSRHAIEDPLLDVGCGRGGGSTYAVSEYALDVVGIDLVPYNVSMARTHTVDVERPPSFVVGDVTRMPFDRNTFPACIAVDSIVYVPGKKEVFGEIARVLEPDGVCVVSDLLTVSEEGVDDRTLRRFADAWDMPPLWSTNRYRSAIESTGLRVSNVSDLTPHSVGRFRKWTTLFLLLADGPFGNVFARILERWGLDLDTIRPQVRSAHDALPALRHVLVATRGTAVRDSHR